METSLQKKARVLTRSHELIEAATRGDSPEEVIAKGQALAELKQMKPWRYEGEGGGFKAWARRHLPYRAARANQYICVAKGLSLAEVAGTRLCFEVLLVLAKAPAGRRGELIAAAVSGASTAELRAAARAGEERPAADQQARLLRLAGQLCGELRRLCGLGVVLSPEALRLVGEAAEAAGVRRAEVPGPAPAVLVTPEPAVLPVPPAEEVDPRGSTVVIESAAQAPAAPAWILPGAVLQVPAEVGVFRPLFRFFRDELSPQAQQQVQAGLLAIVRVGEPVECMRSVFYATRPYLGPKDPRRKELRRLSAALRAEGVAGRRFALYCLLLARLPDLDYWLGELCQEKKLPEGLRELCVYYHGLLTQVLPC